MGAEEGYQRSPEPCPTRPEVSSSPTSLCPSPYLEHTSPRAACPLPTVSGPRPGRRHLSFICISAGVVSGGAGVSGIHLLVGRVHTLRQVLNSLVPQLFSGQAPAGHGSGAAARLGAPLQLVLGAVLGALEGPQGQRACPAIAWRSGQPEAADLLSGEGTQAGEAGGWAPMGGHTEPTRPPAPNCHPCPLPAPGSFPAPPALGPCQLSPDPWEAPVLTAVLSEMADTAPRPPSTTSS